MKYLVMETHPGYAVLLDEKGRFVKAANKNYQVGDEVTGGVVLMEQPVKKAAAITRVTRWLTVAACLCAVLLGGLYVHGYYTAPYATINIEINPSVQMHVSHAGRVVDLKGTNPDGVDLLKGYEYAGKDRARVTNELADRAVEMGYLSAGGQIKLSVDCTDSGWRVETQEELEKGLDEHFAGMTIVIVLDDPEDGGESDYQNGEFVIHIPDDDADESRPPVQTPAKGEDDDDDYGESDYNGKAPAKTPAPSPAGDTDYGDDDEDEDEPDEDERDEDERDEDERDEDERDEDEDEPDEDEPDEDEEDEDDDED
ncbi:MAG: anti-sigma factor domain-containing protein [Christensenellaceae bacterium]|nr:anti-sigma factor domain-containing protein [Christensenellaceae bacterium]